MLLPPAISPVWTIFKHLLVDPVWQMCTFHSYGISNNVKIVGSILGTHSPCIALMYWSSSCGSRQYSNLTLSDDASNHLSEFQHRVLGRGSHIHCINFGQHTATSGSRRWGSCRRIVCAFFKCGIRLWSYFWSPNKEWQSPLGLTGVPPCGRATSTGIVVFQWRPAFFGHLVVVLWWDSRKVSWLCVFSVENLVRLFAAPASWLWELFYTVILQQRIAPNRVSERRIDSNLCWWVHTHEKFWRFWFDCIKTPTECSHAQFVVCVPKSGMRILAFSTNTNFAFGLLRKSVYSLQKNVHVPFIFIECLVSKYWLLSSSAEKPASCDTWATVLLSLLSRMWSPESIRSFRCVKFTKSSVENSGPSRWQCSLFLIVLTKPSTHCGANA